jgi:hypothetical protein
MAQHDYVIANGTGAAVRSDLNNGLSAIVTQNSGATEPATTYAFMRWADTTAGVMKMRNSANNAWITLYQLDGEWTNIAFENGTAAAPSIYFKDSGTDTGFYSPGANQVGISTGGTARLTIDSNGNVDIDSNTLYVDATNNRVGLGTSSPGALLTLAASVPEMRLVDSDNSLYGTITAPGGDIYIDADKSNGAGGSIIRFAVDDVERARIDSSGRLGIGTTSPGGQLDVSGTSDTRVITRESGNSVRTDLMSQTTQGGVGTTSNHPFFIQTNGSERCRVDTSGRLLVGTSSNTLSNARVVIRGNPAASGVEGTIQLSRAGLPSASTSGIGSIYFTDNSSNLGASIEGIADGSWTSGSNHRSRLVFSTTADGASSPTERMRIGQSGFTKISNSATYNDTAGTYHELVTTLTGSNNVLFRAPASYGSDNIKSFVLTAAGTGFNHFLADSNGTTVCVIRGNGNLGNTNNVYTSLSDSKLKENIVDAGSQWSDIKSLQVRKYNFKEDTKYETHTQIGLVAQEVELVSPGLIEEYPDRDAGGNDLGTTTKSVKYSVLYMKAVKALQEAMERIEQLETSNADLLARVTALEAS